MSLPIANGIMATACSLTGLTRQELTSGARFKHIGRPRQAIMYAMIERTAWSTTQIGRWLKRDHSTVIHGHRVAAARMETDAMFAGLVTALMAAPASRPGELLPAPAEQVAEPVPERDIIEIQDQQLRSALIAGSARLAKAIQQARALC